ncbi:MAG: hypothetical protein AB1450_06780 [Pseudomonadota bacterium]
MNSANIFLLETGLCAALCILVVTTLRNALQPLLTELCGTASRAVFWARFTYLMLFIAPLMLVVHGTHSVDPAPFHLPQVLRDGLWHGLLGVFLGLAGLGLVLYRSIPATVLRHQALPGAE